MADANEGWAPPFERTPDQGPQGGGGDPVGRTRDHERRIQTLERASLVTANRIDAVVTAQNNLWGELFGDVRRRDLGGRGAFARIEGLLTDGLAAVTAKIEAVRTDLSGQVQAVTARVNEGDARQEAQRTRADDHGFLSGLQRRYLKVYFAGALLLVIVSAVIGHFIK